MQKLISQLEMDDIVLNKGEKLRVLSTFRLDHQHTFVSVRRVDPPNRETFRLYGHNKDKVQVVDE